MSDDTARQDFDRLYLARVRAVCEQFALNVIENQAGPAT